MRSFQHWTPQYIFYRARDIWYRKWHPDHPWLTPQAICILEAWLTSDDKGIEWGSGKSTLWFARRVKQLVSIEHDASWYEKVSLQLERGGSVDYRLSETKTAAESCLYADVVNEFPDDSFDFALVDGRIRRICMEKIIPKLCAGGLLILDNSERYVPSDSKGTYFERGHHIREFSVEWDVLLARLSHWRTIGTTNGVWCTRFWVKPC